MPDRDWSEEIRRRVGPARLDPGREADLVRELAQHLEDRYQEIRANGGSHDEAYAAAVEELASADFARQLRVTAAERRPEPVTPGAPHRGLFAADLWQDVRFGLRLMRKAPGFTAVATVTLAVALGANTAMFSVVNAVMLRALPFADPDRLVRIYESNPTRGFAIFSASHPNYLDWVQQNRSFEQLAAVADAGFTLTHLGESERVNGRAVTHGFLPTLGIATALGRNFLAQEDHPAGQARVAIVSHGFWRDRFGGDPQILQRTITVNEATYGIIGVLPERFTWGGASLDLLVPLAPDPARSRGDHRLVVIGRLKRGVALATAQADLEVIAATLERQYPESNQGWTVRTVSFYDWLVPEASRRSLLIFLAAVGCVLLIACSNVANLMLARAAVRRKEISVRLALGARRGRLVRQLFVEAVLLALLGGGAGVVLSVGATALLKRTAIGTPRIEELTVDWRVLAFGLGVALATGLLFGLAPALTASRTPVVEALKEGGRDSAGFTKQRVRSGLVVVEAALSVALLVGAGLLLRSFWRVQQVDPGFNSERLLTMRVSAPASRYDSDAKAWTFYEQLIAGIRALPGVQSAAATSLLPLVPGGPATELTVPGRSGPDGQGSANWRVVSPGYFNTMGIPLRGRDFTAHDTAQGEIYTIVSEATARRYWPGEDPIGKRVVFSSLRGATTTIVGVAGDVPGSRLDADITPTVYFPLPAIARGMSMRLVVRTVGEPTALVAASRSVLRSLDPAVPIFEIATAEEVRARSTAPRRFQLFLLGCFAAVALLLASVGLFGVMAYLVSQHVHEIGVRLALGAQRADVFRLVVGRGLLLALGGAVAGLAGAYWMAPSLGSMLFGVEPFDAPTFIGAPALLVAVAAIACYFPARRAMRVDPLVALRSE